MVQDSEEIDLMTTTTYNVRGMTCDHCATSVTAEVGTIPGVTQVAVDVPAAQVTISSAEAVSTDAVRAAVAEAGYEVVEADTAVAGSCCGGSTCSPSAADGAP